MMEEPEGTPINDELDAMAREMAKGLEQMDSSAAGISGSASLLRERLQQVSSAMEDAGVLTASAADLLGQFKTAADNLAAQHQQLERARVSLADREQSIRLAEQARDEGFAEERNTVQRELAQRRADALSSLESELGEFRTARMSEVSEAQTAERERVLAEIARERAEWDTQRSQEQERLTRERGELERQRGAVSALQSELEGRRAELDDTELDLEERSARLRRQAKRRSENLDEEVDERLESERASFESRIQSAAAEAERLRAAIRSQDDMESSLRLLQEQLGGREPAEVISELKTLNETLARQREELASRPTEAVRAQLSDLARENEELRNKRDELAAELQQWERLVSDVSTLKLKNGELEASNRSLEQTARIYESARDEAVAELDRMRAAYEKPAELEARYREIELPRIDYADITQYTQGDVGELAWLESIGSACDNYGLHFNPRILKAFHTALKTAEWSPLTVLAGVSGTGKSELPRLYSHFGGLYFEPLSVQPNWDSQESMLGFFNSIDNRFDAQPVLRFLAQSQMPWLEAKDGDAGYPGLEDALSMVLLDEMNLAHPELYFAEFLSKLELRRGKKRLEVPTLPVKIGAGMKPYELALGRNVLWVGTMNQDETTKSLSDKVLDRSIIIHFPRPTDLKRRQKLDPLDAKNRGDSLPVKTWQNWMVRESPFTDEEVKPYKAFIEEMNTSLAVAGRAIGHRVWQSVEYYMANYPDVREAKDESAKTAAMHTAFEDQLVQKVMPKLRGIDTRGDSKTDCLDKIDGQLIRGIGGRGFNLHDDFEQATKLGYGQFIWQSANYLKSDSADESA